MVKLLAAVAVTSFALVFSPALARSSQATTYFILNQSPLTGQCRNEINRQINSVDSIPWWAKPIARRIAVNDIEAIKAGTLSIADASANLYNYLIEKGMEEGWAADIKNKYRQALRELIEGDAC